MHCKAPVSWSKYATEEEWIYFALNLNGPYYNFVYINTLIIEPEKVTITKKKFDQKFKRTHLWYF